MKHKTPLFLLALGAALAVPGVAHANSFEADADCNGMTLTMPRGEAGTVVTVTVDGRTVTRATVATHGDTVLVSHASPDRTVGHVWVATIDSVFNADQRWTETVGACDTPTTTTAPPTTTTTTVPVAPTTTSVAVTTPPVPTVAPTTLVTTPRPTVSTVPPVYVLPETGSGAVLAWMMAAAGAFVAAGLWLGRGGRK